MQNFTGMYSYDEANKIWRPRQTGESFEPFTYHDGSEEYLMKTLKKVTDKSVLSRELAPFQKDWASAYHFSSARANLLRPFAQTILKNASILELGCGCGAITRYLGETAKNVVAVEGSAERAAIAAQRCCDLTNVAIVADRIQNLPKSIGKFDVVTLIGVLEYSGRFDLSAVDALKLARSFLNADGFLILALENRFGLKYFSGVPEDHLGFSWGGIVGGYKTNGVATWSRKELLGFLNDAGFDTCDQFVPVPDYKLPSSIITPAGLASGKINLEPIMARAQRKYEKPALFNLPATWEGIIAGGMLPDMADSLCFIAYSGNSVNTTAEPGVLVQHFGNLTHSTNRFAKKVSIVDNGTCLLVKREKLCPNDHIHIENYEYVLEDEPYYAGKRVEDLARHCVMCRGWTVEMLAESLRPWVEFILKLKSADDMIPGKYYDLTPFNLIVDPQGDVHAFDLEWRKKNDIPLDFLFARGIIATLSHLSPVIFPASSVNAEYKSVLKNIFGYYSIPFNEDSLKDQWDEDILEKAVGVNILNWEDNMKRALWASPINVGSLLVLADDCASLGIPPEKLASYVRGLRKDADALRNRLGSMWQMLQKVKNR